MCLQEKAIWRCRGGLSKEIKSELCRMGSKIRKAGLPPANRTGSHKSALLSGQITCQQSYQNNNGTWEKPRGEDGFTDGLDRDMHSNLPIGIH